MSTPRAESGRTRCRFLVKAIVAVLSLIVLGVLLGGVSHGVSVGHVYDSTPATTRADDKPDASALVTSVSWLREGLAMRYDPQPDLARTNARPISEFLAPNTASPSAFSRTEALSGRASSRQVSEMADAMRTTGWDGPPIRVVEANGRRFVVDGHHRLEAARRAGIDVPYEVVDPATVIGPGQWSS